MSHEKKYAKRVAVAMDMKNTPQTFIVIFNITSAQVTNVFKLEFETSVLNGLNFKLDQLYNFWEDERTSVNYFEFAYTSHRQNEANRFFEVNFIKPPGFPQKGYKYDKAICSYGATTILWYNGIYYIGGSHGELPAAKPMIM